MNHPTEPLGQEQTRLLLEETEAAQRRLDASEVEALDRTALLCFFSTRGIPPGPWPAWIEIRPALKAELWTRILGEAKKYWATFATLAIDDLAPAGERWEPALDVARAGIEAARTRGGSPLDWQDLASRPAYPEIRPLLTSWARENVVRMRGDWENGYITLGDDPGGVALSSSNIAAPVVGRLVTRMCEALNGPNEERARAWLEALATSPLRDIVPLEIKLDLPAAVGGRWEPLARLRQAYDGTESSTEVAPLDQHGFLERELQSLAQRGPAGTTDLATLTAQFGGELPEGAQRALARWTKPARPDRAAAGAAWLSGIAAAAREQTGKLADLGARAAREQTGKLADLGARAAREQTGKLADLAARAREQTSKMQWPKLRKKDPSKLKLEPQGVEPTAADSPAVMEATEEPTQMQKKMVEWIRGGSAEDDRKADEELIRLFEESTEDDLLAMRKAIAGLTDGILYRLASRAALNPRLLDGVARVVDEGTLDDILLDIAHYDLWGFAPQAAERLHASHDGSFGPLEQSVIRLLRDGPDPVRDALAKELGAIDRPLLDDLQGPDRKAG